MIHLRRRPCACGGGILRGDRRRVRVWDHLPGRAGDRLRRLRVTGDSTAVHELDRIRNPVGYWVFVLVGLILAGTTIAGAAWVWMNTEAVAAWMARHQSRSGSD